MNLSYTIRTIPLLVYSIILLFLISARNNGTLFDFWTPLVNVTNFDFINWFLSGIFNILFVFLVGNYLRFVVVKFSFQDLNEEIPQDDQWERVQFNLIILSVLIVVISGLLLTISVINAELFQFILFIWIALLMAQDLLFHIKFILL